MRAMTERGSIHFSISIGLSFAGDENGNAVFGGGRETSEGLRGRKARKYAGGVVRRVTRNFRVHAFVAISASRDTGL